MNIETIHWRKLPKVCHPKHGQANTKSYRFVKVWQPPMESMGEWPGDGYCCLGRMDYSGPMRTTQYIEYDKPHRQQGAYLVAWWHCQGSDIF